MASTEPGQHVTRTELVAHLSKLGASLAGVADCDEKIAEAVAAEKERIAQVAEDLGAHYHGPDYDRTASFSEFLRGAKA
jgi:hypothetical protein